MGGSLVLGADSGAGGADLAGRALELGVGAFADSTLAFAAAVADLAVLGQAGGRLQRAVAGAARVVGVADALAALAASVSWHKRQRSETLRTTLLIWIVSTVKDRDWIGLGEEPNSPQSSHTWREHCWKNIRFLPNSQKVL